MAGRSGGVVCCGESAGNAAGSKRCDARRGRRDIRRLAAVYAVRDEEGRRPDRSDLEAIAGITFRDGEDIVSCSGREACVDLDSILFLMKI